MNQTLVLQGFYHFCGLNSGLEKKATRLFHWATSRSARCGDTWLYLVGVSESSLIETAKKLLDG